MSEQTNPTAENEELLADAAAAMQKIQGDAEEIVEETVADTEAVVEVVEEVSAEVEAVGEGVALSGAAATVVAAPEEDDADDDAYDEDDVPAAVDDDDDDDDEEADEGDEIFDYEEIAVEGPSIYAPQEVRGRARRIGNDIRIEDINYKNVTLLVRFLDARGRILSRRKTRVSAKVQRRVAREIKRARHLALLPYTAEHIRVTRKTRRSSRQRQ